MCGLNSSECEVRYLITNYRAQRYLFLAQVAWENTCKQLGIRTVYGELIWKVIPLWWRWPRHNIRVGKCCRLLLKKPPLIKWSKLNGFMALNANHRNSSPPTIKIQMQYQRKLDKLFIFAYYWNKVYKLKLMSGDEMRWREIDAWREFKCITPQRRDDDKTRRDSQPARQASQWPR